MTIRGVQEGEWYWLIAPLLGGIVWFAYAAVKAEQELATIESRQTDFSVTWVKTPALESNWNWFNEQGGNLAFVVPFLLKNVGTGFPMKVRLTSRSVRGVTEEYPHGDQHLRWYGVDTSVHSVTAGSNPRVDVAAIVPDSRMIRFLGPGKHLWQELEANSDRVTGEIVVEADQSGHRKIYRFDLSMGTVDPPGLDLIEV